MDWLVLEDFMLSVPPIIAALAALILSIRDKVVSVRTAIARKGWLSVTKPKKNARRPRKPRSELIETCTWSIQWWHPDKYLSVPELKRERWVRKNYSRPMRFRS